MAHCYLWEWNFDTGFVEFLFDADDETFLGGEEIGGLAPDTAFPEYGRVIEFFHDDGGCGILESTFDIASIFKDFSGLFDIGIVGNAHLDFDAPHGVGGDILDGRSIYFRIGDDDASHIGGIDDGFEKVDFYDFSGMAFDDDGITDLERPEDDEHKAGCKVGECALKGESNGESCSANDGSNTGGFDAEDAQAGECNEYNDGPIGDSCNKTRDGIFYFCLLCGAANEFSNGFGNDKPNDDEDDDANELEQKRSDRGEADLGECLDDFGELWHGVY